MFSQLFIDFVINKFYLSCIQIDRYYKDATEIYPYLLISLLDIDSFFILF